MSDKIVSREALEAVSKGATLLDLYMPGWANKIDLGRLDLADTGNCVLGQLFEESMTFPVWQVEGFDSREEYIEVLKQEEWPAEDVLEMADRQECRANYAAGAHVVATFLKEKGVVSGEQFPDQELLMTEYGFEMGEKTSYAALDRAWAEEVKIRQAPSAA